jgi:hypothetical protein
MADNVSEIGFYTNYFYYLIPNATIQRDRYPLYDATKAVRAPYYNATAGVIVMGGNNVSSLYIVTDDITDSLVEYTIQSSYMISTWASHVSSSELFIIGSDGNWSAQIAVPIQNYSIIFTGMTSLGIILIVFVGLIFLFGVFMVLLKACSDKSKRLLRDSQVSEESVSSYKRIDDFTNL